MTPDTQVITGGLVVTALVALICVLAPFMRYVVAGALVIFAAVVFIALTGPVAIFAMLGSGAPFMARYIRAGSRPWRMTDEERQSARVTPAGIPDVSCGDYLLLDGTYGKDLK